MTPDVPTIELGASVAEEERGSAFWACLARVSSPKTQAGRGACPYATSVRSGATLKRHVEGLAG